jgi:uncharacterized protein YjbI with pentapeptide repeats
MKRVVIKHRLTDEIIHEVIFFQEGNVVNPLGLVVEDLIKQGVSLRLADFRKADFAFCNLTGADFRKAEFSGSCLAWTELQDANLTRARFRGAILTDANLVGANLVDANLKGCIGYEHLMEY